MKLATKQARAQARAAKQKVVELISQQYLPPVVASSRPGLIVLNQNLQDGDGSTPAAQRSSLTE